jgi:hypothetical protein
MSDAELIAQLKNSKGWPTLGKAAAARIEALTAEEKAALHEHEKAGGEFEFTYSEIWMRVSEPTWGSHSSYRTVPLPAQRSEQSSLKTQDVIAWEKLPAWVEWVARDRDGEVFFYDAEPRLHEREWRAHRPPCRAPIDDFPGLVQIGTVDWRESKQRRPRG